MPVSNHEIWHTCQYCGQEFDRRIHIDQCPGCGADVDFNPFIFRFAIGSSLTMIVVLLCLVLLFSGCMTQQYGYRRHRNRVAQEVTQYEHSLSAGQDWTRPWRHWWERPKSHWPFND